MRELLDLAVDKGVRDFVRRAGAAGITLGSSDGDRFGEEQTQAWQDPSAVTQKQQSYFEIAIQPGPYEGDRIRAADLEAFIAERAVRRRGWPVPMVGGRDAQVRHHGRWVAQDVVSFWHVEAWRMFASGQFLQQRETHEAEREDPRLPEATGLIYVWDVLLYLVEVAELAARISTTLACDEIAIDVALRRIKGRQLASGDARRHLFNAYISASDTFTAALTMSVGTLLANPVAAGIQLAQEILGQFGLKVSDQTLKDQIEETFEPRPYRSD